MYRFLKKKFVENHLENIEKIPFSAVAATYVSTVL